MSQCCATNAGRRCCGGAASAAPAAKPCAPTTSSAADSATVQAVRKEYGRIASAQNDSAVSAEVARSFGYSADELAAIPAAANMGLSCGNPIAMASLKPGETVVDLGSGGGIDCFLASTKVGPTGRVIGVDMTPEMLALARENARKGGYTNVEFCAGRIEQLPVPDGQADVVISNCVLNLVEDKRKAYAEIYRVLRPGGRVAISDIALRKELPPDVAKSLVAYTGCISGAVPLETTLEMMRAAGFRAIEVVDAQADLSVYGKLGGFACCTTVGGGDGGSCCGGDSMAGLLSSFNVNDYATSVKIYAVK